jgi:hypothetical protein
MFSREKKDQKYGSKGHIYGSFGNTEKKSFIENKITIEDKVRLLENLLIKLGSTLVNIQEHAKKEKDNQDEWTAVYDELIEDLIEINLFEKKPEDISIAFKRSFLKTYVENNL